MDRELFLKRFGSAKTAKKYESIFAKLDEFYLSKGITEESFILQLRQPELNLRYNLLQDLVYFLQDGLSPRTVRNYFDSIFKYLLFSGCDLTHEQLGIRVQFPRVHKEIPEGLDRARIESLINHTTEYRLRLLFKALAGGGLREGEGIQLRPRNISFGYNDDPALVTVTKEIAKFGIAHQTFLPNKLSQELENFIKTNNIGMDDHIFVKKYTPHLVSALGHKFEWIRKKAGLETGNRNKFEKHKIRLHSFRAWFITQWIDLGFDSFGNALAGHTAHLTVYYRKSPEERLALYKQYQNHFVF